MLYVNISAKLIITHVICTFYILHSHCPYSHRHSIFHLYLYFTIKGALAKCFNFACCIFFPLTPLTDTITAVNIWPVRYELNLYGYIYINMCIWVYDLYNWLLFYWPILLMELIDLLICHHCHLLYWSSVCGCMYVLDMYVYYLLIQIKKKLCPFLWPKSFIHSRSVWTDYKIIKSLL